MKIIRGLKQRPPAASTLAFADGDALANLWFAVRSPLARILLQLVCKQHHYFTGCPLKSQLLYLSWSPWRPTYVMAVYSFLLTFLNHVFGSPFCRGIWFSPSKCRLFWNQTWICSLTSCGGAPLPSRFPYPIVCWSLRTLGWFKIKKIHCILFFFVVQNGSFFNAY